MNRLADTKAGNGAKARGRKQATNAQTEERRKAARTDDRERERAIRLAGITNESSREKSYGLKTDKPDDSRADAEGKSGTNGQRNGTREAERKTENKKERQDRATKRGRNRSGQEDGHGGFRSGRVGRSPPKTKSLHSDGGKGKRLGRGTDKNDETERTETEREQDGQQGRVWRPQRERESGNFPR